MVVLKESKKDEGACDVVEVSEALWRAGYRIHRVDLTR